MRKFWSAATLHREVTRFMAAHGIDRTVSVAVLMELLEDEIVATATGSAPRQREALPLPDSD
jgi:hypothetical protein